MTDTALSPEEQLIEDIAGFTHDPLGYALYAFPWGKRGLNWHMPPAHVSGRQMRSERYVITCRIQRRAISRLCWRVLRVTVLVNPHSSQC